jgi:hypothetical protein
LPGVAMTDAIIPTEIVAISSAIIADLFILIIIFVGIDKVIRIFWSIFSECGKSVTLDLN